MVKVIDFEAASEKMRKATRLTSGSVALDRLLGGGFSAGLLYEAFGESNSGKTQLALQTALCAAQAGLGVVYLDTEGSFRPERMEKMAASRGWEALPALARVSYSRVSGSARQMEMVSEIGARPETADSKLVVVDTLTRNFTLDFPGSQNTIRRQGLLAVHMSEMARDAFLNGRAYLLTNRVTFSQKGEDAPLGGATVSQAVHVSVHMERVPEGVKASLSEGEESATCPLDDGGIR